MIYKCQKCGAITESKYLRIDYFQGGYKDEMHFSCPMCGDDELDEVRECSSCGRIFTEDEFDMLYGTSGTEICRTCMEKEMDVRTIIEYGAKEVDEVKINGLFSFTFDESELNEALCSYFMQMPDSKQKEYAARFVESDPSDFADWLSS